MTNTTTSTNTTDTTTSTNTTKTLTGADDSAPTTGPDGHLSHDDPRPTFRRALATATTVVAGIRPEQMNDPTPCDEMDVRAMLGHLVGVLDRVTALGRGHDPFAVGDADAPDDDWGGAWNAAADRTVAAWSDDAVLARPMALPWIQGTGADILTSYFSELTVHTWDLATATGQDPEWDATVLDAALSATDFLPADNRRALFAEISAALGLDEVAMPFADAVAVADDAPPIDRLVAWNGRDPRR